MPQGLAHHRCLSPYLALTLPEADLNWGTVVIPILGCKLGNRVLGLVKPLALLKFVFEDAEVGPAQN